MSRFKSVAVYITILVLLAAALGGLAVSSELKAGAAGGTFGGETGSPGDPYLITDALDLQAMNLNLSSHYALASDIDASITSTWNSGAGFLPVGDNLNRFTGSFDGRGHTITGLFINRSSTSYVGLFGYINTGSTVSNVSLVKMSITGYSQVGGLVGHNNGSVSNSYSTGNVSGTKPGALSLVGGLVGRNYGTVSNSYSTGNVSGGERIGGLVGAQQTGAIISNSYATGNVNGSTLVGGLLGLNFGGSVSNSYSTGNVSGGSPVGGLVGSNTNGGTVSLILPYQKNQEQRTKDKARTKKKE